jgi:hypothetical protein
MVNELVRALEARKSLLEKELEMLILAGKGKPETDNLADRLSRINNRSIKEYRALWSTFTPPAPFPCPFCFVFEKKTSPLKTLPRVEDVEPLICSECGETFEIPVELLYA